MKDNNGFRLYKNEDDSSEFYPFYRLEYLVDAYVTEEDQFYETSFRCQDWKEVLKTVKDKQTKYKKFTVYKEYWQVNVDEQGSEVELGDIAKQSVRYFSNNHWSNWLHL